MSSLVSGTLQHKETGHRPPASVTQGAGLGVPASPDMEWGLQPWGRWEDTPAVQGTELDLCSSESMGWLFCKVLGDKRRLRTRYRPTPCLPEGPVGASQGSPKSL